MMSVMGWLFPTFKKRDDEAHTEAVHPDFKPVNKYLVYVPRDQNGHHPSQLVRQSASQHCTILNRCVLMWKFKINPGFNFAETENDSSC